ncbi:Uncharacterised protein [Slackia heliotrinireducens]|uniref:TadE-like protein n=2 Tax=Slackia TaxID=84108 RepID=C7N7Y9_SLAHD|nr:hypothetical protein [Slackia heliotrinireducens]ACV23024.1 hypothetical protein Shel_20100 [Slackia heliotrinireducens DSM 20476]VEH01941.1 Uncharacterised protein [Slackia heliotrinireducens]
MRVPGTSGESGQMTVELACMFPVLTLVAVVVFTSMAFLSECAAFDPAARDAILMQVDDGYEGGVSSSEVAARISAATGIPPSCVQVSADRMWNGHVVYTAGFDFRLSSYGLPAPSSVFGVAIPPLHHEIEFEISPYRKGIVI